MGIALTMMYNRCQKIKNISLDDIEKYSEEFQILREKFNVGSYKRIMLDGKIRRIKIEDLPSDYFINKEKYKIQNIAFTKGMKFISIDGKNTFVIEEQLPADYYSNPEKYKIPSRGKK